MDDIFYFIPIKIGIVDIYKCIREMYSNKLLLWEESNSLQVYYKSDRFIDVYEMSLDEFDCENREFLIEHGIHTAFCISHHRIDKEFFIQYIEAILVKYGGWLGNDSDKFQPWFNLQNIKLFKYD